MKKIGIYFIALLVCVAVFVLGFSYDTPTQPYSFYQVYLDGELIGTIESKKELEDYINNQGTTIKENVQEYQKQIEVLDTVNELLPSISNEEYDNLGKNEKVKYIIDHQDELNISNIKIDNLKKYIEEKLNEISEKELNEMKEYIKTNEIYLSADKVYSPNGIIIKKLKHIRMIKWKFLKYI